MAAGVEPPRPQRRPQGVKVEPGAGPHPVLAEPALVQLDRELQLLPAGSHSRLVEGMQRIDLRKRSVWAEESDV